MERWRTLAQIIIAGAAATAVRIIGQLLIPAGEQTVLQPSAFAEAGQVPLLITIYALIGYSLLAALFLSVRDRIGGSRLVQGLKYGGAFAVIWVAYLLEPFPHVAPLDRITYPLVDGLALLVMGVVVAYFLGHELNEFKIMRNIFHIVPTIAVALLFFILRIVQFQGLDIYSSYREQTGYAVFWAAGTGLVTSHIINWFHNKQPMASRIRKTLYLGIVIFGLNLVFFNFFMPIVFDADIPDLILRTAIDIGAVTLATLLYAPNPHAPEPRLMEFMEAVEDDAS